MKRHSHFFGIGLIFFAWISASGQTVINGYANVTNISGTTLTVSSVNETNDTFEDGEKIILMQMQDNVIGSNTTTTSATFGNLSAIANAGHYEVATILSHTEAASLPNSIVLTAALTNTYTTGTNSSVQIITFPSYASYTVSAAHSALTWNGTVGGVFAIDVTGTLTIGANISMDGKGFRAGSANAAGAMGACNSGTYAAASANAYGNKGEGIYKATVATYAAARGKILNGGGGGNSANAGGGGGGNYTLGGLGGPGWAMSGTGCSPVAGGLGGIDFSSYISASRIYMGGGGGGGQWDTSGQAGGNGGGIIMIRANTVTTLVSCGSAFSITANGISPSPATNADGGGGGGAGGSIIFQVPTWTLNCVSGLTIAANGGNGGSVGGSGSPSNQTHGGGGGGGKGVIIFSSAAPATNVTTTNTVGTGGANSTAGSPTYAAGGVTTPSDGSADADGILPGVSGPLPISLLYWKGEPNNDGVCLSWATVSELNNSYFTIERSSNGEDWTTLAKINGAGTTKKRQTYSYVDMHPFLKNYYRLSQTDFDARKEYFEVLLVYVSSSESNLFLYPNPTSSNVTIQVPVSVEDIPDKINIELYDANGKSIVPHYSLDENRIILDLNGKEPGNYVLRVKVLDYQQHFKVILK